MHSDRDEMKEAGEILLALRQAPPAMTAAKSERTAPLAQLHHSVAASYAAARLQQQSAMPMMYAYSPFVAYVPQLAGVKRVYGEKDQKLFPPAAAPTAPSTATTAAATAATNSPYYASTLPVMASMMFAHPMRFPMAQ